MRSSSLWHRRAAVLLALVLPMASVIAAAQEGEGEDEGPPPDGAVQIPYQEAGEIRPGEGWSIDCASVGTIDAVTIACTPESIALSADYDPDWGEHPLSVRMVAKHTSVDLSYAVRMEPPPAPEIALERWDMPIVVGAQAMVPLSALRITCEVCTAEGGAVIEVGELPPGVSAGVSESHLSVRSSTPGDVELPLRATDDAGQSVTVELGVSFVSSDDPAVGALHVVTAASEWDLNELAWGEEMTFACTQPRPSGLECAPDGTAVLAESPDPAQIMFRVIAADGAQSWGSITVDPAVESAAPAAPSWQAEAPLHLVYPPSGDSDGEGESLLAPLTLLLEGIPGP